ncbi:MAG: class II glutamine amidotransferase [Candidatus Bathyarchaeia archaeon]
MYASVGNNAQLTAQLRDFRVLAEEGLVAASQEPGHKAGWGIVAYSQGQPIYIARRPTDASTDPAYLEACSRLDRVTHDGMVLVHLRKAAPATIGETNTHPFTYDCWAFAHNGGIKNPEWPQGIPLEGSTDSERFFKTICLHMREGRQATEAIRRSVEDIRSSRKYSSLTFLMTDGRSLYAYREYNRDAEYYTLLYAHLGDSVLLCQEPLWNLPWQETPNRALVTVEGRLKVTQVYL